jgi:phosphoenolpyruvate---glycerone phosphotransferase subunit DhaL
MGEMTGTETIADWLLETGRRIDAESDRLCALDAALGDGDHGTNMRSGFEAVRRVVEERPPGMQPGPLLTQVGKTLISTIGGASGALWGFAFRRAGRALGEEEAVDAAALAAMLEAMVAAVVDLGEAEPGDKTMLDALLPAAEAFRAAVDRGASVGEAASSAATAARAGADATATMEARKGRASFMGERSMGHQDPSANSAAIVLAALARTLEPARG